MNVLELSEQEIVRRQSLQELRDLGIDPYPAAEYPTDAFSTDIRDNFKDDEQRQVCIAGRMMTRRVMGKASFMELQDSKGRIQVYITRDDICPDENKELYNTVFKRLLDIGDFVGVKGFVFRTQTGEISVHAKELTLLSKSIKPLPIVKYKDGVAYDKFDDPELRFRQRYVDLVVNEMIPAVAAEGLADFVDVFCDEGFFTPEETGRILQAGTKYGMRGKIHGQELAPSGGVEVALKHNALSVDHLESMTDEDIAMMIGTETSPTALPGTSFFLNIPFAPVRKMISAGLGPAIASDYNPGSTPSGDMKFVVSLACIKMRLLPEEAFNAATINGAYAMGLSADYGSIAIGKVANFYITHPIPSIAFIPYAYTTPVIREVYLNGERQN